MGGGRAKVYDRFVYFEIYFECLLFGIWVIICFCQFALLVRVDVDFVWWST